MRSDLQFRLAWATELDPVSNKTKLPLWQTFTPRSRLPDRTADGTSVSTCLPRDNHETISSDDAFQETGSLQLRGSGRGGWRNDSAL